jgi:predicted alpha/beta-fold hydrolase
MEGFRPHPLFRGGWAQTIAGHYWPSGGILAPQRTHVVRLPDGDELVVAENSPADGAPRRVVALLHGLTGTGDSGYMGRLARALVARGCVVARVNLRGCGPGFGRARQPYHSGRSEDARAVVAHLAREFPRLPLTLGGFSLGGNIVLKMAGEDGAAPTPPLDSVIAVSPPADLAAAARRLALPRNRVFDCFFVRELRREVARQHRRFPDLPPPRLPRGITLTQFDEHYTAPRGGFAGARDYYARASSRPLIPRIAVPTLILSAMDDPVVDSSALAGLPARPGLDLVLTERGGHVGFLARGPEGRRWVCPEGRRWVRPEGRRWMDEVVLRWIADLERGAER